MSRRALIVRHIAHEELAGFRAPVESAGYAVDYLDPGTTAFAAADFVAPDLLILMGGPMGVYETDAHPWLADELGRLAARIAAGRPTLGVCLGSQMIAAAMGARVYAGPVKEVGFAPVALSEAGAASPLRHLEQVPMLHWHGDTFDLPEGAELLAATRAYPHQAFRRGGWLLALQFHPEMGAAGDFAGWLDGSDAYLAEAGTNAGAVRRDYDTLGSRAVAAGQAMLAEWLAGLDD